jgi:hypothetical protein
MVLLKTLSFELHGIIHRDSNATHRATDPGTEVFPPALGLVAVRFDWSIGRDLNCGMFTFDSIQGKSFDSLQWSTTSGIRARRMNIILYDFHFW